MSGPKLEKCCSTSSGCPCHALPAGNPLKGRTGNGILLRPVSGKRGLIEWKRMSGHYPCTMFEEVDLKHPSPSERRWCLKRSIAFRVPSLALSLFW